MNNILLLTRLQIMQTLGGLRATVEKRAGSRFGIVGTVLISLLAFGLMGFLGYQAYGLVGPMGLNESFFSVLFLASGTFTFVFSVPSILSTFFASSDINDLLPLPVTPLAVSVSKALSALTTSYAWTLLIVAGPLAGWGVASGAGVSFWVALLLAIAFAPMMPTAYAGTLSIFIASVFKWVRRKDVITTITTVLTLGVSVGLFFVSRTLSSTSAADALTLLSDSLGSSLSVFPAYGFLVSALVRPDPLGCLLFVLISLLSFVVFALVTRVLYLRVITSLTSSSGKTDVYAGQATQAQASAFSALLHVELNKVTRNSPVLINYVVYPIAVMPVLMALNFSTGTMDGLGDSLAKLGDSTTMLAGIGITLITLLANASALANRIAATAVSREGSNWIYMKYIPVPMNLQIRAKAFIAFAVNAVVALLFTVFALFILVGALRIDALVVICGGIHMLASGWLTTCVGMWCGSRHPSVDWGNDDEVNIRALRGGGDFLRILLVGVVYSLLPLLASPITGLEPRVFIPVIALAGVVVAVLLGRSLLAAATRNVEAFE